MLSLLLAVSCADSKTFNIEGQEVEAKPYGWMNRTERKIEGVEYKVCVGNIVWSVVLVETVAAPVLFTGLALFEPVSYGPENIGK